MHGKAIVGNAADREQVRRGKWREEEARDRELSDLRSVLSTREGRRFVWRFLDLAGVFRTTYTGDNDTFFREGRRSMGLMMLADTMEADPQAYMRMAAEDQAEREKEAKPETGDERKNQEERTDD